MSDMLQHLARPNRLDGGHAVPPRRRQQARPTSERAPVLVGWLSSDADEIERRPWRGRMEVGQIEALEGDSAYFGNFRCVPPTVAVTTWRSGRSTND